MSDAADRDLLAAEFALGTLEGAERAEAALRIARDPAFAHAVAAWERRLAPLAALAPEVPPPDSVWTGIAATLDRSEGGGSEGGARPIPIRPVASGAERDTPRRPGPGPRFWQGTTVAALALAAGLAAVMVLRPVPSAAPTVLAVLAPRAGGPALVALATRPGEVTILPAGALSPVPAGREMELWFLPQGAHRPRPMGALPPGGRSLRRDLAPGTRILVSLEPAGGSPSGLPTGPVLFAGTLRRI